MTGQADGGVRRGNRLRPAIWGAAALLLLTPLVAMQFTDEVAWGPGDFALLAVMLAVVCGGYEVATRMSGAIAYRLGAGVALVTGFLLVWMNLAVGIIGDEGDPANLLYAGVLAVGAVGAAIARLRPLGMALTLVAMAVAQGLVAVIALAAGLGETFVITGVYMALWLASAGMFWLAAKQAARRG